MIGRIRLISLIADKEQNMTNNEMNLGTQPLDQVLTELELDNHALVDASTEHLTHKMVNKGRKGRRLTRNIQTKILNALNTVAEDKEFSLEDLFNYKGKA